jgi:hypothetical protein
VCQPPGGALANSAEVDDVNCGDQTATTKNLDDSIGIKSMTWNQHMNRALAVLSFVAIDHGGLCAAPAVVTPAVRPLSE